MSDWEGCFSGLVRQPLPTMTKRFDKWKAFGILVSLARGTRSQRALSRQIGISAATICRIEAGGEPTATTFLRLCDWLTPKRIARAGVIAQQTARFLEKFK